MEAQGDTIAAIASPGGQGGIGIVRVSGDQAKAIGLKLTGCNLEPRVARATLFRDKHNQPIDKGIALFFESPASFTGEDILELQGHGGPMVLSSLLEAVLERGARLARPGEFSERAFLNGKIDLAQAEAIADLIASGSQAAARGAMQSLVGVFSARVQRIAEGITALRTYVEASIDFSDEEIDFLSEGQVVNQLDVLGDLLRQLLEASKQGAMLRDGAKIAIIGEPNVGKSSLLNAFSGEGSAIVTDIPGTTRDTIVVSIVLDGLPLTMVDTAGIRETDDPIEMEGVRRAMDALGKANLVLHVTDISTSKKLEALSTETPTIFVENKVDLTKTVAGVTQDTARVSARTGAGLDALKALMLKKIGFAENASGFIARQRHVEELKHTSQHLDRALVLAKGKEAGELIAEELKLAHQHLGEIVGITTSDDLLGKIFESFCIGK